LTEPREICPPTSTPALSVCDDRVPHGQADVRVGVVEQAQDLVDGVDLAVVGADCGGVARVLDEVVGEEGEEAGVVKIRCQSNRAVVRPPPAR
jgi:hypothetical protein